MHVVTAMRWLTILVVLLLVTLEAEAQDLQCVQVEFSGEARQGHEYSQQLGDYLSFSVEPMRLREDSRWGWFQIRVIRDDGSGVFVFNLSDRNWLLAASDFWSVFIGGPNVDLIAALQYHTRYLVSPVSADDKERAAGAANLIVRARTPKKMQRALAALRGVSLAQIQFEITDYGLRAWEPPMSVEWVKFNVKLILPPDFRVSGEIPLMFVQCPAIPDEVVENIRNPERHKYLLGSDHNGRKQP
jgi:hypothetical protein